MDNPLVVGYKGEIGSFILNGLLRVMPKALDIWCVDVNETEEEVIQRIRLADVIFLSIPMDMTVEWLVKYKDLLRGKRIIEQCSLKEWIYEDDRVKDIDVRSMHILFRPSQTPNVDDRNVGLFRGQFDDEDTKIIEEITKSKTVWYEDSESHDGEMAIQQALVHRMLLILGDELKGCSGSTYISKRVLELTDRIKKGDVDLYEKIQANKRLDLDRVERGLRDFNIRGYYEN